MAADLTKSVTAVVEALVLTAKVDSFITSDAVAVTVPSIGTAGLGGTVNVTVTGAALGDAVIVAAPNAALPTNAFLTHAYVSATNTVTLVFQAIGGTVTGAAVTGGFDVVVASRS